MADLTIRLTKKADERMQKDGIKYLPLGVMDTFNILNKLGALEDLIDQGFLHIFPCKEGDHIFLVDFEEGAYDEGIVQRIYIENDRMFVDSDYEIGTCVDSDYVFFSEEAARQAVVDYEIK